MEKNLQYNVDVNWNIAGDIKIKNVFTKSISDYKLVNREFECLSTVYIRFWKHRIVNKKHVEIALLSPTSSTSSSLDKCFIRLANSAFHSLCN